MSERTCPLCGADASFEIHQGARYAPQARIRQCGGCALIYLTPQPTVSELDAYYAGEYLEEYEGTVSPEGTYARCVPEARDRASRLGPLLNHSMRVLEIGASCGAFLEAVRPFVGEVVGVEPGHMHREWAAESLGLTMTDDLGETSGLFDLIALFHTLEHVREPVDFVRALRPKLADGGRIVIEVPNVDDALRRLYEVPAFADFYFQRAHLYYFSPDTLAKVIAGAGGAAAVRGIQRYDLSNHLHWLRVGRPGGQGAYREIFSTAVNAAYAEALVRAGYADTLWAIATFES